ncbi:MAG: hypothetical protein ACOYJF_01760 [Prevotella sp.]|jgi:hypothetical protein
MKRLLLLLISMVTLCAEAQTITRKYNNVSMAQALRELNSLQNKYTVDFIYDELEDFRITVNIHNQSVPDAIRYMIGLYPITLTEEGNNLFVECISKDRMRFKGHLVDENGSPLPVRNMTIRRATSWAHTSIGRCH